MKTPYFKAFVFGVGTAMLSSLVFAQGSTTTDGPSKSPVYDRENQTPAQNRMNNAGDGKGTVDGQLSQKIWDSLNSDTQIRPQLSQVRIEASQGTVTLRGEVRDQRTKDQIEQKVSQVDGVNRVQNQIRVN